MNNTTMLDALKIVNYRVVRMLNSSDVNSEIFYRDVRTLTELIEYKLENEKKEGGA